ncbi:MAG: hypothetical protein Q7J54_07095 [Candidatus Woesearchaeota archaeon]|nr:hypothetical protein [Candidatus Woesearchaeota archaeon]
MKLSKIFLVFVLALMFSSLAYAASFTVKTAAVNNRILIEESANFLINITNLGETADTYRFSSIESWNAMTDPPKDWISGVDVNAKQTATINISLNPFSDLPVGWVYPIKLKITSDKTKESVEEIISIYLSSGSSRQDQYMPAVSIVDIDIEPKHVDPTQNVVVTLNLKNRNRLNLSDLTVKISSDAMNKEDIITLNPLEQRSLKYAFAIDPYTAPKTDELKVTLIWKGAEIEVQKQIYDIIEYSTFASEKEAKKQFLKTVDRYTVTNEGNVAKTENFKVKTHLFYWLFTATSPKAKAVSEDGVKYLEWSLTLDSQDKATVRVVTTYRPFWSIIVLIIIAVIAYYIFRSPIVSRKRAVVVATEEGGISELKVIISVRNRSNKIFDDVRVIDRVSNIAEVMKEHYLGTLAPSKILYDTKKGTILKWELDTLDKNEERIITYKIKSKLSVIGGFSLKSSAVKFRDMSGKEYFTRSNSTTIGQ